MSNVNKADSFNVVSVCSAGHTKPILNRPYKSKIELHSLLEPYLDMEIGFDIKDGYRISIDGERVKCFDCFFKPVYY